MTDPQYSNSPRRLGASHGMQPRGPLMRLAMAALAIVVFIAATVVGAMLFLALLGVVVFVATWFAVRIWWLRRRYRRNRNVTSRADTRQDSSQVINGDYRRVQTPRQHD